MALGNLDINTMERIDDFNPDATNVKVLALGRMINISHFYTNTTHSSSQVVLLGCCFACVLSVVYMGYLAICSQSVQLY